MIRAAIALIAGCVVAAPTLAFSADAARGTQPAIYFSEPMQINAYDMARSIVRWGTIPARNDVAAKIFASIKTPAQNAGAQ